MGEGRARSGRGVLCLARDTGLTPHPIAARALLLPWALALLLQAPGASLLSPASIWISLQMRFFKKPLSASLPEGLPCWKGVL